MYNTWSTGPKNNNTDHSDTSASYSKAGNDLRLSTVYAFLQLDMLVKRSSCNGTISTS